MQLRLTASPRISADCDSVRLPGDPSPAQAGETRAPNPAVSPGPIELRRVYRMSVFAAGTVTAGTAGD